MNRPSSLAALLVIALSGCHHQHQEPQEQVKFLVTSPLRKDTELTKDFVAQIRAIQHIEVRALEKGYLQGIFVDEGQHISKGAKMFQIMPRIYQAEVQKATAETELSEIDLKNTKLLADKNVVSPNELALAKAKYSKARADVLLAVTHKSLTEIHAPFEGLVGRFHVRLGSLVDEGDLLTTFSDNSSVWVYFNVSEAECLKYESQPDEQKIPEVKLQMANGEVFDQTGKVETIEDAGAKRDYPLQHVQFRGDSRRSRKRIYERGCHCRRSGSSRYDIAPGIRHCVGRFVL